MMDLSFLPEEVLELVFSHIPLPTLLDSVSSVCHQWRKIIRGKGFLPNRKRYHKYLSSKREGPDGETLNYDRFNCLGNIEIPDVIRELQERPEERNEGEPFANSNSGDLGRCLSWLIHRMENSNSIPSSTPETFQALCSHSRYRFARALLTEMFPGRSTADSHEAIVTMIVVTAKDIYDVREIFQVLQSPCSPATNIQVTELLYELAGLLLLAHQNFYTPARFHYLIHTALLLHDSVSVNDPDSRFSPVSASETEEQRRIFSLTGEQRKILSTDLTSLSLTSAVVKIIAYAGTGKTTTLVELCKRNPSTKFLLVLPTQLLVDILSPTFPANVTVKTVASVGCDYVIKTFGRERFHPGHLSCQDLIEKDLIQSWESDIPDSGNFFTNQSSLYSKMRMAGLVISTLKCYFRSTSDDVVKCHVEKALRHHESSGSKRLDVSDKLVNLIVQQAKGVWNMIQGGERGLNYDWESGVKALQLSKDIFDILLPHQVLMLDEAHDLSPCAMDIFLTHKSPKIISGDPHQCISLGQENPLSMIAGHPAVKVRLTFHLTQSFRFGPEIGFVTNACLSSFSRTNCQLVVGGTNRDTIDGKEEAENCRSRDKVAVLSCGRLSLFQGMLKLICHAKQTDRPFFSQPGSSIDFQLLRDLIYFKGCDLENVSSERKTLFRSTTFEDYAGQVREAGDSTAISYLDIIALKISPSKLIQWLAVLEAQSIPDFRSNRVKYLFNTVEKMKGLECRRVLLLEDFYLGCLPYIAGQTSQTSLSALREHFTFENFLNYVMPPASFAGIEMRSGVNTLYTAASRAKCSLILNPSLFLLLNNKSVGYNFESLVLSAEIPLSPDKCPRCGKNNQQNQGVARVEQVPVRVGLALCRRGGVLCHLCSCTVQRGDNTSLAQSVSQRVETYGTIENQFNIFFSPVLRANTAAVSEEVWSEHLMWLKFTSMPAHKIEVMEVEQFGGGTGDPSDR